jgi:hypothetical protein
VFGFKRGKLEKKVSALTFLHLHACREIKEGVRGHRKGNKFKVKEARGRVVDLKGHL